MTNEEARKILIEYFCVPQISGNSEEDTQFNIKMQTAFNTAIKALEQYGALPEIRSELTKAYADPYDRSAFRYTTVSLLEVLDLIDKHLPGTGEIYPGEFED